MSRSGVFRYCKTARVILTLSSSPDGLMFSLSILLADCTASSALVFAYANPMEVSLLWTPYYHSRVFSCSDLNSGLPSLVIVSSTPMSWNNLVSMLTRHAAPHFPC